MGRRKTRLTASQKIGIIHTSPPKPRCGIAQLPIEIICEIALRISSPEWLLSFSRSSKFFCDILVDPKTAYIWIGARKMCMEPEPIPDPTPNWTEPAYAAFIFDGGNCEVSVSQICPDSMAFSIFVDRSVINGQTRCTRLSHCEHAYAKESVLPLGYI